MPCGNVKRAFLRSSAYLVYGKRSRKKLQGTHRKLHGIFSWRTKFTPLSWLTARLLALVLHKKTCTNVQEDMKKCKYMSSTKSGGGQRKETRQNYIQVQPYRFCRASKETNTRAQLAKVKKKKNEGKRQENETRVTKQEATVRCCAK